MLNYINAYEDAILDFIEQDIEIIKNKTLKSNNEKFLVSFYQTCLNMIENGVEISHKQKAIIEREMNRKKVKIPKISDFTLSLKIYVRLELDGKSFTDKVDIGDFILLLNKRDDFNAIYEKEFNNETHIHKFHERN